MERRQLYHYTSIHKTQNLISRLNKISTAAILTFCFGVYQNYQIRHLKKTGLAAQSLNSVNEPGPLEQIFGQTLRTRLPGLHTQQNGVLVLKISQKFGSKGFFKLVFKAQFSLN